MYLSMFRVIRTADQTPAKEVLEEFLRFIGCMVNDNPITDWQEEQPVAAGTENIFDILLCPVMDGQQAIVCTHECLPGENRRALWTGYRITRCCFRRSLRAPGGQAGSRRF